MKIKFLKDLYYNGTMYQANTVYELEDSFAVRWLKRGCERVETSDKVYTDPREGISRLIVVKVDELVEEKKPAMPVKKTTTKKKVNNESTFEDI